MLIVGDYKLEDSPYGEHFCEMYPVADEDVKAELFYCDSSECGRYCVFKDICINAVASTLKDGEKKIFICPKDCKYHRETTCCYAKDADVVIFPGDDSPCYVLPRTALRGAKRLAGGIEIEEKLPEFPEKEKSE